MYNKVRPHPTESKENISNEIIAGITTNQLKATIVINWLLKRQSAIGWNKNRNITVYGQIIPETDFTDILQGSLRETTNIDNVPGLRLFFETLKIVKAPSNLFKNRQGKKILSRK